MARDRAYLAPLPFKTNGDVGYSIEQIDDWGTNIRADGLSYLRNQPAYRFIQESLDLINGDFMEGHNDALSDLKYELTYRNTRELVAAQTNLRIIPVFKTEIDKYKHQSNILNKAFMSWQWMTQTDRAIRKAWQYACVGGTGYIGVRYDPNLYHMGSGDIKLDAYGPLDVMPVGITDDHNLQSAYAVVLRVRTPIHLAWRLFPKFRDKISASRESIRDRGVLSRAVQYSRQVLSPVLRRWGQGIAKVEDKMPWEYVNVYYAYVDDDSVNNTGRELVMGEPGTTWCYTVPYIGQEVKLGEGRYRKAQYEDCKLYPNRRLIKFTDDFCLNPDPTVQVSPYWHAKVPLAQFRADDWAWNFLGFPITRGGRSIEKTQIRLGRAVDDASQSRLNPASVYNRNGPAESALMEALDTRVPGARVGLDLELSTLENQFKPLLPPQYYEYPATILEFMKENDQKITHQMGVADAIALARARQLPSGDSTEKILSALGELIKDQSKNMESSIITIGELWKSCFFQFISAARRLQWGGPDWLVDEDWDYDPGTLIPAEMPPEQLPMTRLTLDLEMSGGQPVSRFERARWHKDQFAFAVLPYSLHEFNSITRKLFYNQLQKSGFPIDWWTLADIYDVRDFGDAPMMTDPETGEERKAETVLERWLSQMEIMARIQAASQGAQPGKKQGRGRPGSGQQPPTLEQKGGGMNGARSVVRESKH